MTTALAAVDDFLSRLYLDHGMIAACVGGAARDIYLGREPKDYDFVFLDTAGNEVGDVCDVLVEIFGGVTDLTGNGNGSEGTSDSQGQAAERGLDQVWEVNCPARTAGKTFQFLLYNEERMSSFGKDPAKAVAWHDCSLNHAWLARVGGRIVARVTDEFPNPATGNLNFFASHVNYERKAYIRDKFPEFTHQF